MPDINNWLAFYYYPFVPNDNYIEYTKEDLMNPEKVIELFDYCQILEASINKKGWDFLIEHYGYEGLYEIDKISGWIDGEDFEDFKEWVEYYRNTD